MLKSTTSNIIHRAWSQCRATTVTIATRPRDTVCRAVSEAGLFIISSSHGEGSLLSRMRERGAPMFKPHRSVSCHGVEKTGSFGLVYWSLCINYSCIPNLVSVSLLYSQQHLRIITHYYRSIFLCPWTPNLWQESRFLD